MPDTLILYRDEQDLSGLVLSTFVDVAKGGINPGDGETENAVFGPSSAGYGEPFLTVNTDNRQFTVQLLLNGTSKDTLHAQFRYIEERLLGMRPMLEWKPDGASSSTYYYIRYGKLIGSDKYDYWLERIFYARRVLALVTEPYGRGARMQSPNTYTGTGVGWAASGIAPSNPVRMAMPSIGGDRLAALRIAVHGSAATQNSGLATLLGTGLMPISRIVYGLTYNPSSLPYDLTAGKGTAIYRQATTFGATAYIADGFAPGGGQAIGFPGTIVQASSYRIIRDTDIVARASTIDGGLMRVFGCVRNRRTVAASPGIQSPDSRMQIKMNGVISPVATLLAGNPSAWQWIDLGDTYTIPGLNGNQTLEVGFAWASNATAPASYVASPAWMLAGFAFIPKNTMYGDLQIPDADAAGNFIVANDNEESSILAGRAGQSDLYTTITGAGGFAASALAARSLFFGDRPVMRPTPTGVATGPFLHMLVLKYAASPMSAHDWDRPMIALGITDRYRFAK